MKTLTLAAGLVLMATTVQAATYYAKSNTVIRSGASSSSSVVTGISKCKKVTGPSCSKGWCKVSASVNGKKRSGFVHRNRLKTNRNHCGSKGSGSSSSSGSGSYSSN